MIYILSGSERIEAEMVQPVVRCLDLMGLI